MTYIIALISILLGSFAQYFLKVGMNAIDMGKDAMSVIKSVLSNQAVWGGLICYGLSMVFWLVVLSRLEMSKAYPLVSLGYIFAIVIGYFLLDESVNMMKILGVVAIVIGVVLIARS